MVETRAAGPSRWLTLRPVLPQDADLLARLVDGLPPAARRHRFHGAVRLSAGRYRQMSTIDHRRQVALVVSTVIDGSEALIADARCVLEPGGQGADFALMVADRWQRQGVGTWAMQALQRAATAAGCQWLQGEVLQDNLAMLGLMRRCGFAFSPDVDDDRIVKVRCPLGVVAAPQPVPVQPFWSWLRQAWPAHPQAAVR